MLHENMKENGGGGALSYIYLETDFQNKNKERTRKWSLVKEKWSVMKMVHLLSWFQ